jgi:ubiquinone biosynthesis protein
MMISKIFTIIWTAKLGLRILLSGVFYRFIIWYFTRKSRISNIRLERFAKSLLVFIQNSGPSFIKLGQALSTRPDITGDVIADRLSMLQDKLPSFDFKYVKEEIEFDLGGKLHDHFESIDQEPVAAASVAQVHKAKTVEGDIVAVKVLRPNIEKRFEQDVAIFQLFASILNFMFYKHIKHMKLNEVIKTFKAIIKHELNLIFEAAACDQIRHNCEGDNYVKIPTVYWKYSGKRVLTTEWIHGISLSDKAKLQMHGYDPKDIVQKISVSFFNQAYRDGFFHADLHPGNLMLDTNGNLVMIDFGIVGILPDADRLAIAKILYAFLNRDYAEVARLHIEIGYLPKHVDLREFTLALRGIGEPIIGQPVNKISVAKLLKNLFEVAKEYGMELQTHLILLQKTMITLEGVGYSLYPDINMWQLAEPWIKEWADETFSTKEHIRDIYRKTRHSISSLPVLLDKVANYMDCKNLPQGDKRSNYLSHASAFILGALVMALLFSISAI